MYMTIAELYEEFFDGLVSWCGGMCGDETAAEDMVQEAFARALTHAETLERLHPMQARAWLYTTIKNIYLDRMRHRAFESVSEEIPDAADDGDDYADAETDELISMLPYPDGIMFRMRYLEGYSSKEIGEMFNMPSGTVRSRLSETRRKLRKMLKEE